MRPDPVCAHKAHSDQYTQRGQDMSNVGRTSWFFRSWRELGLFSLQNLKKRSQVDVQRNDGQHTPGMEVMPFASDRHSQFVHEQNRQ